MKSRLVLWGSNPASQKVLFGIEMLEEENKVNINEFVAEECSEEFVNKLSKDWKEGQVIEWPDHKVHTRDLSVAEGIIPDGYTVDQPELVKRAQSEWHFLVLSNKLFRTYRSEIEMIQDKIGSAEKYGNHLWDELKGFWDKVQAQINDKNLFREHIASIKEDTNKMFDALKEMRKSADAEFDDASKLMHQQFDTVLNTISEKIEKGMSLQPLFDQLRKVQGEIKTATLSRKDRNQIWDKLDNTFKAIKEKRSGKVFNANGQDEEFARNSARMDGLIDAIDKMEKSINRDKQDMNFQTTKGDQATGQLEAQLRQAKILMVQERIDSKSIKLADMLKTKEIVSKRIESLKIREEKRKEQEKVNEVKKEIEAKIADDIRTAAEGRVELDEKLEKAAKEIIETKKPKQILPPVVPAVSETDVLDTKEEE